MICVYLHHDQCGPLPELWAGRLYGLRISDTSESTVCRQCSAQAGPARSRLSLSKCVESSLA